MMRTITLLVVLLWAWEASLAFAQMPSEPSAAPFLLRPAGEPRPALKYRFVPDRPILVPGNASVFYHRGIQMTIDKRNRPSVKGKADTASNPKPTDDLVFEWIGGPITEIPKDQARTILQTHQNVLNEIEQGTLRATCDWEFDRRTEAFSLLLPEIQEMRSLGRLVALKARMAILDGKTEEAIHWIQAGLVMGRHVASGPTLIQSLVGVAIDLMMIRCLEEVIEAPGTPSLYWALADRPRPFIDLRIPLAGERSLIEKEFPGLADLDKEPWSLAKTRKFTDELQSRLFALGAVDMVPGIYFPMTRGVSDTVRKLGIAAVAAKIYPQARKALIEQGRPEAEVDAMPVIQAATLYCYREYLEYQDNTYKWLNLPYWQSYNQADRAGVVSIEQKLSNPLLTMFRIFMPAFNSVRIAEVRLERRLDALQCIEAIRIYAASHEGKLPPSLEAINEAPAPFDPATGKPFVYKLDGDSAVLSAPMIPGAPNHPSYQIRYVLKLSR